MLSALGVAALVQLLVSSEPPGRLDLEKLKDVLLEAESRRPRP